MAGATDDRGVEGTTLGPDHVFPSRKALITRRPAAPDFSGWNCVAKTFPFPMAPTYAS